VHGRRQKGAGEAAEFIGQPAPGAPHLIGGPGPPGPARGPPSALANGPSR
jgi:hypothetical protein